MAKTDALEEYKIVSENLKWYSNMRFAQLTLFIAITAAIANGISNERLSSLMLFNIALKIGGILVSCVFWYLEMRADDYWSHFMKRAVALESELKFKQYTERPKRKLRTTVTIRLFITAISLFWLAALILNGIQ